ncbi:hypothetical protein A3J90_00970 [candidate division WOR-1 bacterium RIFOXYC2_FULL_37_10]|uniref:Methionine synthase n=1 Tax=candidate division WOR-1 bacterium RIFOXYB2_FULL_37_13 TaxID=1802579 RepID=A0A1F4STR4_UNCSA|nr:MAG: hypothetical protein A2246_04210 [candidate division WOR-1 bacterium RIFOXYA2_FULL_37_7]OGC23820.1 MAG: hypothetical protein A2310_04305 [candidate division WOR-1 bacterium RIFOXYB2_FULL_37_13]OGC33280.1 MAG: hypothetical protein A3J90_00970 [candidate division WOR-1 bacterium RIFOXYC2_FULL_37_10]
MSSFTEVIGKYILIIDGAMGTLLMEGGVKPEDGFDFQNIKNPELVKSIHQKYIAAGADIIETNTFGANRLKLEDYGLANKVAEINKAGVSLAKKACGNEAFVCGSIGPLGRLLSPLGDVSFDLAAEVFGEQAKAMEESGADCVSIETISDLQEMRAAVIGVKAATTLPIISSLTYDENGITIFGTPPESAVVVLESLGVDIISANCSTGPEGILKVAKKLLGCSQKPVMVMPNAGMPIIENDKAVYKMTPREFASFAQNFAKIGVAVIGGCCGTTPAHIAAVRKIIPRATPVRKQAAQYKLGKAGKVSFSSRGKVLEFNGKKLLTIGERINPTGRKILREEIKSGNFNLIREEAVKQAKGEAHILDVNISVPEGNDTENMKRAVDIVQKAVDIPLSIDSANLRAIETGLKEFCGKALLNSVNAKKTSLEEVLPLAKKYGSALIGLTLNDTGIPSTAEERVEIAGQIVREALKLGLKKEEIFIDNLVMTAAIGMEKSLEALKAIPMVKKKYGVKTSLGISNISHGLPNRNKINALFLQLAMLYGLDAAIIDITDPEIAKALKWGTRFIGNKEKKKASLIKLIQKEIENSKKSGKPEKISKKEKTIKFNKLSDIENAVIDGDANLVKILVGLALEKNINPQAIIDKALTKGMEEVGDRFSRKIYFLPQVLSSAEAMTIGFNLCKEKIPAKDKKSAGKILIATVHGDIHDIGKNIVKMMLENHGFEVIDLGKDVPTAKIIEAVRKEKPNAIALSALLTTTMLEMRQVTETLKTEGLNAGVIIGGAVVTDDYAERINASYGSDAAQAVRLAKEIIKKAKKD